MAEPLGVTVLRDATLREGLDVPGVALDRTARVTIATALAEAGLPEAEVVAPSRVLDDLPVAAEIRATGAPIRLSGLIYASGTGWRNEAEAACEDLDHVDLLMPLSRRREPYDMQEKAIRLERALDEAGSLALDVGAGFPHATQVSAELVAELARRAASAGAARITIYDTNGSAEPFEARELVARVVAEATVPVFFHAHNDLGLATANAWAAVVGGAAGLDVTVNGLGDRAGNASLEQTVALLGGNELPTGVNPAVLPRLSWLVSELSGVPVPALAPVVGRHAFEHKSPTHLEAPGQFEGLDPSTVGRRRRLAPDAHGIGS